MDIRTLFKEESFAALNENASRIHLQAGETLFYSGEPGSAFYLVEAGSLGVYSKDQRGNSTLKAIINSGETVGEMAVISGERRSATVIAIRDCILLRLSKADYRRLIRTQPKLAHELNRILSHRLLAMSRRSNSERRQSSTITFLSASPDLDPLDIAQPIMANLQKRGFRIALISSAKEFDLAQLNELELAHDRVFFIGTQNDDDWNRLCARQADRIIITGYAEQTPPDLQATGLLRQQAEHQLVDLVLWHRASNIIPGRADIWRAAVPCNRHFHLIDDTASWQRLARIINGRAIGLVLSGGGARAYAHIGVLRACHELNLPIDFIGGTSMGGIIAACFAQGWGYDEIFNRIKASFVTSNPLSDYTLPILSLVRGRKVDSLLRKHFSPCGINDLQHPYYCVSANLTTSESFVHNDGELWRAIRASIALPGILPPITHENGLLVDGGVLENMPVEAMRTRHHGRIIAVDVARDMALDSAWLKQTQQRNFFARAMAPPIIPILMRAGTVSSEVNNRQQAEIADLVITPRLEAVEIRDWRVFEETIEIGYREAMRVLKPELAKLTR